MEAVLRLLCKGKQPFWPKYKKMQRLLVRILLCQEAGENGEYKQGMYLVRHTGSQSIPGGTASTLSGTKGNWEHKLCPSFYQLSIPEGLPFDCLGGEPVPPEQQVKLFSAQAEGGYLWLSVKAKPYMLQFGT